MRFKAVDLSYLNWTIAGMKRNPKMEAMKLNRFLEFVPSMTRILTTSLRAIEPQM